MSEIGTRGIFFFLFFFSSSGFASFASWKIEIERVIYRIRPKQRSKYPAQIRIDLRKKSEIINAIEIKGNHMGLYLYPADNKPVEVPRLVFDCKNHIIPAHLKLRFLYGARLLAQPQRFLRNN